jgi:glycerol 3-phosphatase-1
MRTIDVLRRWCKIEDPKLLETEVIRFESAILAAAQSAASAGGAGIEVLPGVKNLLDQLSSEKDLRGGKEGWAICTSSTFFYAGYPYRWSHNAQDLRHCRVCHQGKARTGS